MKISLKWLNEYVDVSDFLNDPTPLSARLTAAGLEVESVANLGVALNKVVVGKIVELARHPNADRLTVCQVDAGEGKMRQIVCGAKNHKAGDFVAVALPGAVLPGDFAIKESKIRDIESKGMLCSEVELGIRAESDGILILPSSAPVGEDFATYYGLDDVVLEINVTPNRADCLSHIGLAREISALFERKIKIPVGEPKSGSAFTKKTIQLELMDRKGCPRYSGRAIKGVKVGPSPDWLKGRLQSVGLNSINNVVDVTNFVMFEFGQPLHAFDVRALKGAKVCVEKAKAGEKFISFDETEIKLSGNELTIRDGERAVALAGIVGGKNSGVENDSTDLFIESAHFAADGVRRTMRKLGIQTDSAYRFSRGTDPSVVVDALNRACDLIQQVAGGEVAGDHYDLYPEPLKHQPIQIDSSYVSQRLGYEVNAKEFAETLKRLGCGVGGKGSAMSVDPPQYRWDLSDRTDLVEEYGRIHGYDRIPESFPQVSVEPIVHALNYTFEGLLSSHLVREGYSQAVNYGFISSKLQMEVLEGREIFQKAGIDLPEQAVKLKNPINEDLDVMRMSLLPGLFKNLLHNLRYGNEIGRLFEIGQAFVSKEGQYIESPRMSLVAWGQPEGLWRKEKARAVVYDLKGAVERVLERMMITSYQWQAEQATPPFFHPAQTAQLVVEGRPVGLIGSLHPALAEREKLRSSVAFAEIDFVKLMRGQPRQPQAESIAKFPSVERDLALVMPEALTSAEVIREIKKAAGPLLRGVEVFDVFRGGNLTEGQKSVAFRMRIQDDKGTLTDQQLTDLQKQVLATVSARLKLDIRQ